MQIEKLTNNELAIINAMLPNGRWTTIDHIAALFAALSDSQYYKDPILSVYQVEQKCKRLESLGYLKSVASKAALQNVMWVATKQCNLVKDLVC